jgi:hypothetical protein
MLYINKKLPRCIYQSASVKKLLGKANTGQASQQGYDVLDSIVDGVNQQYETMIDSIIY